MESNARNWTEEEWRKRLTPEQFRILREKGTEPPGSGKYIEPVENGRFACAGCGAQLFDSKDQFNAYCGWPSFSNVPDTGAVAEHIDLTHGMVRTEVTCANCGGHLGHVFKDGPPPTGLRYCINSVAIELVD